MKNPIGPDGLTMERHHPGRQNGQTDLITKTEHDLVHEGENKAVKKVFQQDNLTGPKLNPNAWTAGARKKMNK